MARAGLEVGRVIGERYRLEKKLGEGAFGSVWLAHDATGAIDVALKILHPELRAKGDAARRFEREIEVLRDLEHPCIARALDWELKGEHAYLAMEHAKGIRLDRLMVEVATWGEWLSLADIRSIFTDLAGAIGYAHSRGVVHRDLKPANVLVASEAGEVTLKVLDFGVARLLGDGASDRTTVGRLIGSPAYLSPEQIDSSGVDERADIFALGCILFELLTAKRAWLRDDEDRPLSVLLAASSKSTSKDRLELLDRIRRGPRPRPSACRAGVSAAFDEVVLRALDPEPDHRHANVRELLVAATSAFDAALAQGDGVAVDAGEPPSFADATSDGPAPAFTVTSVMPVGLEHDEDPDHAKTPIVEAGPREPQRAASLVTPDAPERTNDAARPRPARSLADTVHLAAERVRADRPAINAEGPKHVTVLAAAVALVAAALLGAAIATLRLRASAPAVAPSSPVGVELPSTSVGEVRPSVRALAAARTSTAPPIDGTPAAERAGNEARPRARSERAEPSDRKDKLIQPRREERAGAVAGGAKKPRSAVLSAKLDGAKVSENPHAVLDEVASELRGIAAQVGGAAGAKLDACVVRTGLLPFDDALAHMRRCVALLDPSGAP